MKTMEKDDKAADETKDDDKEREICRIGVMDNIDLYTQVLEVMSSLKLCTVILRASRNLKKVVEAKFFKFVIQRDKGKEEMFRVYVEKKGKILKFRVKKNKRFEVPIALRGEDDSFALVHTGKDHLILHLWESGMGPVGCQFVGSRYMVELDGGSMHIIRPPASNTCYMLEDDYYLKQFEILKECPSMKGLSTHACMSIVVNIKNKGIFKSKVVLEEPMEAPSLFFHVVPKVIFGGRHVIMFRRKEGNTVYNHLRLRQGR
ncbi:hypothetical protein Tco_0660441 [Tanacetum coccineum]